MATAAQPCDQQVPHLAGRILKAVRANEEFHLVPELMDLAQLVAVHTSGNTSEAERLEVLMSAVEGLASRVPERIIAAIGLLEHLVSGAHRA
jgi:uncharacterized protein (DUF2342 family)